MTIKIKDAFTDEMVEVKVGDYVCFKCDIEQSGQITDITGEMLTLKSGADGFCGGYIGGSYVTTERASDCWVE
tara:strand:+ start:1101 stop:1319 length:219 start_codon:yes stop_codon:yes gene_type:complete